MVSEFPRFLDEFEALLTENEILLSRTQGVGVLPRELAVNASITGPMLRASGVNYDIRKVDKYGIYDRFNFRVPLGEHGDVYDRYMVRILEMRESREDSPAGAARHSRGADHGSEGEAARLPARSRAKPTAASRRRKASWAFISSATARPIRTATACARPASST